MPINKSMMADLKKQYGANKAKSVYYAIEAKDKAKGISIQHGAKNKKTKGKK